MRRASFIFLKYWSQKHKDGDKGTCAPFVKSHFCLYICIIKETNAYMNIDQEYIYTL